MRTKTIKLYKFDELPEAAKANARDNWRTSCDEHFWADEWNDSLKGAEDALPFNVKGCEVSAWGYSFVDVEIEEDDRLIGDLYGVRAWKYLHANGYAEAIGKDCPFTGYCGDEDFLAPLRAFLGRPRLDVSLADLFQECADGWRQGFEADMEYQSTDEFIGEELEANECEFLENGDLA